mgnify:CR=1 FL=1
MMGMGQQMPMRRPPMGPSPMTAGRPNPMAGGGQWATPTGMGGSAARAMAALGGGGPQQPPPWAQAGMQGMAPWMRPPPPQMPAGGGAGIQVANVSGPRPTGPQGPDLGDPWFSQGCNHRVAVGNGSAAERRASVRT